MLELVINHDRALPLIMLVLVSGGASGVDRQAARFARKHHLPCKEYLPQRHGREWTPQELRAEPWRRLQSGLVPAAAHYLHKRAPTAAASQRFLLRNAKIAWNADALLAVSSLERVAGDRRVKGGTGWTVQMACLLHGAPFLFHEPWADMLRELAECIVTAESSSGNPLWPFQERAWWRTLERYPSPPSKLLDRALPVFLWDTECGAWLQAHVHPRKKPFFSFRLLEQGQQSSEDVAALLSARHKDSSASFRVAVVGSREVASCEALEGCLQALNTLVH